MEKETCPASELAALRAQNEELLRLARKMHTWIFLNTCDEQKAYDEIGLTGEQNAMLGYLGSYELAGEEVPADA